MIILYIFLSIFIITIFYIIGFNVSKSYYKVDERKTKIIELKSEIENYKKMNQNSIDLIIRTSDYLIDTYDDYTVEDILVKYKIVGPYNDENQTVQTEKEKITLELNSILDRMKELGYESLSNDEKDYLKLYNDDKK
jgi:hypothetical protein